jgi:hypothetical protein
MTAPMPTAGELEPSTLQLDELRALRTELQHEDDAISYVRRLAQAELHNRAAGDEKNITGELPAILGTHLTGGQPRPPRPADDFSHHPMALALEELCNEAGSTDLPSMNGDELIDYLARLHEFEQLRSQERKELFVRIDALSAELVRRYRDGEADVDGLLAQD